MTDPEGNVFTYAYDASGRLQSVSSPGGYVDHYLYDGDSRLRSRGGTEVLTRDARGKLVSRTDGTADGAYTFRYSSLGNLRAMEHGLGTTYYRTEYYTPDALGNAHTVDITDPGQAPRSSDPSWHWIRAYDQGYGRFAGARSYVIEPMDWQGFQPETEQSYDGFGNMIFERDYAYYDRSVGPNCPTGGVTAMGGVAGTSSSTGPALSWPCAWCARAAR